MKNKLLTNVSVFDLADKGKAVGKANDKVVFITGAVPGDECDVEVFKTHKSYDEGRMVQLITRSPDRREPFCAHFGLCGGCSWQHLDYPAQLRFKQKQVADALERLAGIPHTEVRPILAAPGTTAYRNKLEFTFTNKRYLLPQEMLSLEDKQMNGLGFHIPGKFNKVLDIETCHLQESISNEIRNWVRTYALENGLTFYDLKQRSGLLRNLVIRNTTIGEWMVVVVFANDDAESRNSLLRELAQSFPVITSLHYVINTKGNDTIYDLEPVVFSGKPYIVEQMEHLKFMIGPKSFFQTNSFQALELYRMVRELADLKGTETVYDLYTGTGTIASFIAARAGKIVGVESVPEAIADARTNALNNSIQNVSFVSGDIKDVLTPDFFREHGAPDVVITDPPRAGMHESVVNRLATCGSEKIIYVSCNPATQARDIKILGSAYRVDYCQPVDMFPHTTHVENVIRLRKT